LVEESVLQRVLAAALRNGGEFAEVYVEDRRTSGARLDDGKIEEFTAGRAVWDRRRLGSQETAVVTAQLGDGDRTPARTSRLILEPVSLQELVRYAAGRKPDEVQWTATA
jgi:hypothetical protein